MRYLAGTLLLIVSLVLISPMLAYWWGLSQLDSSPVPSEYRLSQERELEIWHSIYGIGEPRVVPVSVYGYISYLNCFTNSELEKRECESKYPGLHLAGLAVRKQVVNQVRGKGNAVWQFSWLAYTIWATNNWDIHQIIATYEEAINTSHSASQGS